ncbi:hypothetical protein ACW0KB_00895 [Virgibacillus salarius]|nr:hypothetical protein [Priestia megaterium]
MKLVVIVGVLVFIGLLFGGFLASIMKIIFNKQTANLYLFASGILIGIVVFMLVPEAMGHYNRLGLIIGILGGVSFMLFFETNVLKSVNSDQLRPRMILSSFFLIIGIVFHNLPAGLMVGMELDSATWLLDGTLLGPFVIHQIPEGMALFVSFLAWTDTLSPFLITAFTLAFFMILFIAIGHFVMDFTFKTKSVCMGIAIGTLGYASIHGIHYRRGSFSTSYIHLLLGVLFILIYTVLIKSH